MNSINLNNSQKKENVKEIIPSVYLENKAQTGGGCGKSSIVLRGYVSQSYYSKIIRCYSLQCPECSRKGGAIHRRRIKQIQSLTKNKSIRQFVFTVPKEIRNEFRGRKSLNRLVLMVDRIMKSLYKDNIRIIYVHLVGDKSKEFHPHINVHVVENPTKELRIDREELLKVKERYKKALVGYTKQKIKVVDVHYSFVHAFNQRKVNHRIKYMSDPTKNKREMGGDMKGFRYLRVRNGKLNDNFYEGLSEKCEFVGIIDNKQLDMLISKFDYEEMGNGWRKLKLNKDQERILLKLIK